MAAIDELKEQRDELRDRIIALQARKAQLQDEEAFRRSRYDAQIADVDAKIAATRARRDSVALAIRDLTDSWRPA